jgi:hypothetical protein
MVLSLTGYMEANVSIIMTEHYERVRIGGRHFPRAADLARCSWVWVVRLATTKSLTHCDHHLQDRLKVC